FNEAEGVFVLPWVRTHATKDYLFMGKLLQRFPQVRVTFNFVPSLLRQLQLYMEGKEDRVMALAKKRASLLTEKDKQDILSQFFWVSSPHTYASFPRYRELKEKALLGGQDFGEQDFLDLQVLYQLIWFDPITLREDPGIRLLQEKGRHYQEEDKEIVWRATQKIFAEIFSQYRGLLASGQIEISFSPFYHPILPLLVDTEIARVAHPGVSLPATRFAFPQDARAQIQKGKEFSETIWGVAMNGMWPSEGSVSEEALSLIAGEGVSWVATDEEILRKSLGKEPGEALYLPYRYGKVSIFFRDRMLSDAIGFEYHRLSTQEAIADLTRKIDNLKSRVLARDMGKPYVVSIVLDGENAWEYYVDNGLPFLSEFYQILSQDPELATVTPSQYLLEHRSLPELGSVVPGSWIFGNFDTWIGHWEKNQAWEELGKMRVRFEAVRTHLPAEVRAKVEELFYQVEGSDWFWWLGEDHPSPQKGIFWGHFSSLIAQIARLLQGKSPVEEEGPCTPKM
ncbi:MAG: glycoside hydrolase family 57 protein, partial [Candidatus Caldatribacteriaceae bacterium]